MGGKMDSCDGPIPPVAARLSRPFARRGKFRASSFCDRPHHDLAVCKVVLLLAALGVLPAADAMRGRKEVRVINALHLFERFCFRDGVAELTVRAERLPSSSAMLSWRRSAAETVDVMICPLDQFDKVHGGALRWPKEGHCNLDFSAGCDVFPLYEGLGPQTIRKEGLDDTHYFLIRNCVSPSGREDDGRIGQYKVVVDYTYINTDGSQLSCEYSVFPELYLFICAIWGGTAVVWIVLWVWRFQQSVALQRIISVVPVIQVSRTFVTHLLWKETELTGHRSMGLVTLGYFCNALFTSSLFTALLTLSKGFMILHWDSSLVDRRTLSICMCWMVVSSFAYDLLGGFFVFMLVLVVLIILRLIFISINQNHQLLCSQYAHLLELGNVVPEDERSTAKELISVYSRFRSIMSIFIFMCVMLELTQTFVLTYRDAHLYPALDEAIDWFLVVSVGWLFRCRRAPGVPGSSPPPQEQDDLELGADTTRAGRNTGRSGSQRPVVSGGGEEAPSETVMVVLPGPNGVWASARMHGEEASGDGALTYDQLLERVAIGVLASSVRPPVQAQISSAQQSRDATPESGGSGGSSASRILALLPFNGGGSRAAGGAESTEEGVERGGTGDNVPGYASATVGMVTSSGVGLPQSNIASVDLPGSTPADPDAEVGWVREREGVTMCDKRQGEESLPVPSVGTALGTVVQPVDVGRAVARQGGFSNDPVTVRVVEGERLPGVELPVTSTGKGVPVHAYIIK